nr:cytochrome c oxidase subunit 3 [Pseudomonas sp. RIT-PI-AD]
MWLFIASEIMMFGGLLLVIWFYRLAHPQEVAEALASMHWLLASGNTALLLSGSLCMTLALAAARAGEARRLIGWLLAAAVLGAGFLVGKSVEYTQEYHEGLLPGFGLESPLQAGAARLFMNVYFTATALHGVHILVAVALVLGLAARTWRGGLVFPQRAISVEMIALYWHAVDLIWLFLYPSLYLAGRGA